MTRSVDVVDAAVTDSSPFGVGPIASAAGTGRRDVEGWSGTERVYAEVLAEVVESPSVSIDDHFFDDLGVDSMVMAKFCARVRKRHGVPAVSMKDIYRFSTVRSLAAALADVQPTSGAERGATGTGPATVTAISHIRHVPDGAGSESPHGSSFSIPNPPHNVDTANPTPVHPGRNLPSPVGGWATIRAGRGMYAVCGAAQFLFFVAYACVLACVVSYDFEWIYSGGGPFERIGQVVFAGGVLAPVYGWIVGATGVLGVYVRSVVAVAGSFVVVSSLPVLVKWVLVGRWKATEFPVWGWRYIRFWVVKTLVRMNPVVLFVGSPLFNLYLRALGAKIGRGVLVLTPTVPVCTDLLSIGAGSVIRKDVLLSCYRAHDGMIQTGAVSIGENVFVSESTVVDIDTSMGDDSQLGHASSLHRGQSIPAGQSWHGTPAQPCETDFRAIHTASGSQGTDVSSPATTPSGPKVGWRRGVFSVGQLVSVLGVRLPVASGGLLMVVSAVPWLAAATRFEEAVFSSWGAAARVAVVTAVAFAASLSGGLLLVALCSRLLRLVVSPGRVYRLYGTRYWAHRAIARLTNRKSMTRLFGDSSYIVGYLRFLGYGVDGAEQTGSNFGTDVKHESPFMSSVGAGTMVADGLSLMNTDYTATTFRVSPTVIGAHNFLGNRIAYPAGARTGDNCLLATKVMVPVDGPVRENVGLLGSPAFEIPRSVERDHRFDITDAAELRARLRAKNRHNLTTMFLHLLASWGQLFGLALIGLASASLYSRLGILGVAAGLVTSFAFRIGYFICVDRCVRRFLALRPSGCSIYDKAFWRHERFWKLADSDYIQLFNGTPFKNVLWRLLGVKIGRRVFDDGAFLPERTFATIGDHVTLNAGSIIQCHSQEDGAFKSDRTVIGSRSTLGVGSFVHYGVVMAEHVTLDADAFLMKGEQLDAGTQWIGNPARPTHIPGQAPPATDEGYVTALLARISALESTIDRLAPARTAHPATKPLAAALAVLTIAGGVTGTAHTTLPAAFPAAWHTLLTGLTPTTPPMPAASAEAGNNPAPAPSTVPPVSAQAVHRVPVAAHSPVMRARTVPVHPALVLDPPESAQPSAGQAEAALKQAEAEVKAAKAAQKKSEPTKDDSKSSKDRDK